MVENNGFNSRGFPQIAPLNNFILEPPSPASQATNEEAKVRCGILPTNPLMLKSERIERECREIRELKEYNRVE